MSISRQQRRHRQRRQQSRPVRMCHVLIRDTAKKMAEAAYEEIMRDNLIYPAWKARNPELDSEGLAKLWVERTWSGYIDEARRTLAGMLQGPLNEDLKLQIYEALLLDSQLPREKASVIGGIQ